MFIRQLTSGDAADFMELRLAGLSECPAAFASSYGEEYGAAIDEVSRRIAPGCGSAVFGAFSDSSVLIGTIGVRREHRRKMRHKGVIWGMYVRPEYRGAGVGRVLLKRALQFATSTQTLRHLTLRVATVNASAKALYESVGFRCYGSEPEALMVDGEYYDEDLMIRVL